MNATTKGETTSQAWRCLACHRPLGYLVRRGKRHTLVVVAPVTLVPIVELRSGTVYCLCGARREWYPDETKQNKHFL